MLTIPRFVFIPIVIFFAITLVGANKTEATITAAPSSYAVKDQDGVLLTPDESNGKAYTVAKDTTLTFEVSASISLESDDDKLICEWYNSKISNDGNPIATVAWWWWTNNGKNPAAPPQAPEQTNTPDAPANKTEGGLFAFKQTFGEATPENRPIKITAGLYASEPGTPPCSPVAIDFFVNVEGPPDQTSPDLTPVPAAAEVNVGIGDRVLFELTATDAGDNLQAIEWYVEEFEAPLRANGVNTLNLTFGSPNEDRFAYRFEEVGRFDLTALAYDDFSNASTFTWTVLIQEPLLTRSQPHAAETSVSPVSTESFRVLANIQDLSIDGVCWQNNEGTPVYMPIEEAIDQGDFLAFTWETSFDFGTIDNFFETVQVTTTGYTEEIDGTKTLVGNTVTWVVRAERHVDNNENLNFCGLKWKVKQSNPLTTTIPPGNNYFYSDNVSVDTEGLHLKMIQQDDGAWSSAELFTVHSMPRGIYRFYLEGGGDTRLDQLDPQVVFSPFFYSDDTREIDIEFSNWPASEFYGPGQLQYVVQPSGNESLNRFELNLNHPEDTDGKITCQIDWQNDRVIFKSWSGHSASPPNEEALLAETWTYEGGFIPESGDALKLHINLYLRNNFIPSQDNKPDNNSTAHVIVRAIDHPACWEEWKVENFGERQALPDSTISNFQDDPDLDNCPNLLEYALGSDPWKSDKDRQPQLNIYQDPDSFENYLEYSFTRRKASPHPLSATLNGIHYTPLLNWYLKSKSNLADTTDWMDEAVSQVGGSSDLANGTEKVTYRTESAVDEAPGKFLQLQIEARDL